MPYKAHQYWGTALLATALFAPLAKADTGDDELLRARADYEKHNAIALSEDISRLQNQHHVLAPYADYWLMLLNLNDASDEEIQHFLTEYADYPFADKVRAEYLKKLAKSQRWPDLLAELPNYQGDDSAVACAAAEARAVQGDLDALAQAQSLWMQPKEQAPNCASLYDRMQAAGKLSEDDIIARLRMALAADRLALAKSIVKRSKGYSALHDKLIERAYAGPTAVLSKRTISFNSRIGRELNLFALQRLAKASSNQVLQAFKKIETSFNKEEKAYFYGRLAQQAALRHEPQAVQWFKQAGDSALDKDQLAWYARAALRAQDWPSVLAAVNKMEPTQAEEGAWRYWKARALKAQNQPLEANGLFAKLSTERHFYGWLAEEELDSLISAPSPMYKPSVEQIDAMASVPAIQRAEALYRLDMRWEAKLEWAYATKEFDDPDLLAAAAFAQRKKWYDLAIITADKTAHQHDFALRYPIPYRDLMKPAAAQNSVDEAWVYGITRQESRFMHFAKSGVGAAGLMQLMPATAKWAASKAGISGYHNGMIHELDTNIALGTFYMAHTKEMMKGQETMATAAYNAGPGRAKKWAAEMPLEGAIYAETIPFNETRLYVQKVMANAHLYAQQLGLKVISLKQRLGTVPGKSGIAVPAELASEQSPQAQTESGTN